MVFRVVVSPERAANSALSASFLELNMEYSFMGLEYPMEVVLILHSSKPFLLAEK